VRVLTSVGVGMYVNVVDESACAAVGVSL